MNPRGLTLPLLNKLLHSQCLALLLKVGHLQYLVIVPEQAVRHLHGPRLPKTILPKWLEIDLQTHLEKLNSAEKKYWVQQQVAMG
jgi:hypothetical protein